MATIYVTTDADSGAGSLRAAIASAASGDVIRFAPSLNAADVSVASVLEITAGKNITIESGVERLMARLPTDQERKLLNLGEDGVVVAVQRLSLGASNRPLDVVEATYDARRYGYESRLVRPARGKARSSTRSGEYHHENDLHESRFGGVIALGPRHGPWPRGDRRKR
jgi:hypothetical protein